ncbi:hypothetical protein VCRA2113O323_20446 [Vibrio crassostreae]|nr:hypothetical protein VCRA2113O323_20446 [Vibrio crassostreae]CAK2877153.1 hypothetical protein VCRA2113O321_30190 [Vibrio crassostreae]
MDLGLLSLYSKGGDFYNRRLSVFIFPLIIGIPRYGSVDCKA